MGDLLDIPAENPQDNAILERIKKVAAMSLPQGWKDWVVTVYSKAELLGSELDPLILNKLRYAPPTVALAQAFDPEITLLPERVYRDFKVKMLEWPFCIGLIIGPPSLAARIRSSAVKHELIMAALEDMRPLLLPRKKACRQLLGDSSADGSSDDVVKHKYKKRVSRLDKLEENQTEMRQMFQEFLERFQSREALLEDELEGKENISELEDDDVEDTTSLDTSSVWKAPTMTEALPQEDDIDHLDFTPKTQEQDPPIPAPRKKIEMQGVDCQRLGSASFNKVRYAEVQRKLQATPVFSALKVNSELLSMVPKGSSFDYLTKMDTTLACIIHGLLLQREAFSNAINDITVKHPDIISDFKSKLMGRESEFRSWSDDVLQFACGRRAEAIDLRRKTFKPINSQVGTLLEKIPPSSTHLFEEDKLADLYRQHNSSFRYPIKSKEFFNYPVTSRAGQQHRSFKAKEFKGKLSSKPGGSKKQWKGDSPKRLKKGYKESDRYISKGAGARHTKRH
nr:unnamed protein product [Callosobruchus chinensis]